MFSDALKQASDTLNNVSVTENGALGFKTTFSPLVDFNFKIPFFRDYPDQATEDIIEVINSDFDLALRYLFYLRDARGGLGERNTFRVCFAKFLNTYSEDLNSIQLFNLLSLVPEYGRWDDLIYFCTHCDYRVSESAKLVIKDQLVKDIASSQFDTNSPVSLLAKWLPSVQGSQRKLALMFAKFFGFSEKKYRKTLVFLRKRLNIVETKMSARRWEDIDYSAVPSKANVKYNNAFLRNDKVRRTEFLDDVAEGKTKINSSTNFPSDVLRSYVNAPPFYNKTIYTEDKGFEALWRALPDYNCGKNILVVADTSGSMGGNPLLICYSLAIYFAEHTEGQFKNKAILFSANPRYLEFPFKTLREKFNYLCKFNECSNTNIEKTFDLVLNTAVENNLPQEELPQAILIISDMEFDSATGLRSYRNIEQSEDFLFAKISKKFEQHGYKLPRLVFWNVAGRTNTIPMTENKNGLVLVSGYSPAIVELVLSGEFDPYTVLKSHLMTPRYNRISEVFSNTSSLSDLTTSYLASVLENPIT